MDQTIFISELIGQAYPPAIPLGGGRLRRHWIVRTAGEVPTEGRLHALAQSLEGAAVAKIQAAYGSVTGRQLTGARPAIRLRRLDDRHLVVQTDFADAEGSVGDAAAISQWGVLQDLDREVRVDDLQGLPSEHWFQLRTAREANS